MAPIQVPVIDDSLGKALPLGPVGRKRETVRRTRRTSVAQGPTTSADAALLRDLRKGADGAVEILLEKYQARIFSLAMSILKNESDAQEAVQDVFLSVVRNAGTFKGNSALYSWIYRICVNTCLMRLRGRRRAETVPLDEVMPVFTTDGEHARPVDDWSRDVERRMLNKELGDLIRQYTDELPDMYRVVFILCDVEGMSNGEAAQILGATVAAVKTRLHRARLVLRARLSRYLRDGRKDRLFPASARAAG